MRRDNTNWNVLIGMLIIGMAIGGSLTLISQALDNTNIEEHTTNHGDDNNE